MEKSLCEEELTG